MRYLGLALFAEGSTDHRFLSPILSRLTEDLCLQHSHDVVEIGAILELHSPPKFWERDRATRIAEAAREARGAFNILFIHTDDLPPKLRPHRAFFERLLTEVKPTQLTPTHQDFIRAIGSGEPEGREGVRLLTWGDLYLTAWLEALRGEPLSNDDYRTAELQRDTNPFESA